MLNLLCIILFPLLFSGRMEILWHTFKFLFNKNVQIQIFTLRYYCIPLQARLCVILLPKTTSKNSIWVEEKRIKIKLTSFGGVQVKPTYPISSSVCPSLSHISFTCVSLDFFAKKWDFYLVFLSKDSRHGAVRCNSDFVVVLVELILIRKVFSNTSTNLMNKHFIFMSITCGDFISSPQLQNWKYIKLKWF